MTNPILTVDIPELGKLAALALREEPWEHAEYHWDKEGGWVCPKCGTRESTCSVPDPIDCEDWNIAMKWRDWVMEKYKYKRFLLCLFIVWEYLFDDYKDEYINEYLCCKLKEKSIESLDIEYELEIAFYKWVVLDAKPHYIIRAILLCVEGENDGIP